MHDPAEPVVAVSFDLGPQTRDRIEAVLPPPPSVVHLNDLGDNQGAQALGASRAACWPG